MGAAEMVPEPLGMIRVEPHRLLDPRNAFFRAPEPGQHLALLHDDEIVVGIEDEGSLLVERSLVVLLAGETHGGQDAVDVAVVAVEIERSRVRAAPRATWRRAPGNSR